METRPWDALLADQTNNGEQLVLSALTAALVGSPEFDEKDMCDVSGVDPAVAAKLWAAMGFVAVDPADRSFTASDLEALSRARAALDKRPEDVVIQQTRVLSSMLARVADVVAETLTEDIERFRHLDLSDTEVAAAAVAETELLDVSGLLDYLFRRQLVTALAAQLTAHGAGGTDDAEERPGAHVAVFFADLVGYTALSQELDDTELAALVTRFHTHAFEIIGSEGGRIVKTLGDEVMVVCSDISAATTMAGRLVQLCAGDEELPDVRVGLAYGPVLALGGDYFGPTVNLASRLTGMARPGTLLASDAVHEALPETPAGKWARLRIRRIKGIGWSAVWALKPE